MNLEKKIDKWDNEQCLFNFSKFFERVQITTRFIQDSDGYVTHQVLEFECGDKAIYSEPQQLEWPLIPAPIPEDIKKQMKDRIN